MNTTYHVTVQSIGLMLKLVLKLLVPLELIGSILFFAFLSPVFINPLSTDGILVFVVSCTLGVIVFTLVAATFFYRVGTFLRLSPSGLEYHRWPFTTITCLWSEVEQIAKANVMGMSIATLMIPKEEIGWEMPVGGATLGSAKYKLVPLNDFQGWPDGDLMQELMQYAPKLFS
jgi:hypothetical protein